VLEGTEELREPDPYYLGFCRFEFNSCFWRKVIKLKFRTKRDQRGTKAESNKEDVESNIQERPVELREKILPRESNQVHVEAIVHEEESSKEDVESRILEYTMELRKKILVEESNQEQVEATIRGFFISEREEKLQEKIREMEQVVHKLLGQMEEMERKGEETEATLSENILQLTSVYEERVRDFYKIEQALHGEIRQLKERIEEMERKGEETEATLRENIHQLNSVYEERVCDFYKTEQALHCETRQLKEMIEEMERKSEETEASLRHNIHELSSAYEERKSDFKKIEQALRGQIKQLKKRIL